MGVLLAEAFSRTIVKLLNFRKTMLGNVGQIRALGKELTDQAVGVLVQASLPRRVGLRKVNLQRRIQLQLLVFGKLLPVFRNRSRFFAAFWQRGLIQFGGGVTGRSPGAQIERPAQQQIARLPLDQRDRSAASGRADDRVAFPIAETAPTIDDRGPPFDARSGAVSPAFFPVRPLSAPSSETALPVPSGGLLGADPDMDRLVRNPTSPDRPGSRRASGPRSDRATSATADVHRHSVAPGAVAFLASTGVRSGVRGLPVSGNGPVAVAAAATGADSREIVLLLRPSRPAICTCIFPFLCMWAMISRSSRVR